MQIYWAMMNFIFFLMFMLLALSALVNYSRDLLNKKNYVLQLPQTSSQNLQEIQLQCEDILDTTNYDRQVRLKQNGKSKFQLMELSTQAIQDIRVFIASITYISIHRYKLLVNYHYINNLIKDDTSYPKIVLQKTGMTYLFFINLVVFLHLRIVYQQLFYANYATQMEIDWMACLYIALILLPFNMLLNKYLVHLEYSHGYYALFNNLKFKKEKMEEHDKEIQENLIYDREHFKEYTKPVKLIVQSNEHESNYQVTDEENKKESVKASAKPSAKKSEGEVEILFMKVDSLESQASGEDEDEKTMIEKLEQQDDYKGLYYLGLATFSLFLYLGFINYHNLFHASIYTDYVLLLSAVICLAMDVVLRYLAVFLGVAVHLCLIQKNKTNIGNSITKLQIYEVFEEHIKFGMYFSSDDNIIKTEQIDDYSLDLDALNQTNVKSMIPKNKFKHQQDEHWFFKEVKENHKKVLSESKHPFPQVDQKQQKQNNVNFNLKDSKNENNQIENKNQSQNIKNDNDNEQKVIIKEEEQEEEQEQEQETKKEVKEKLKDSKQNSENKENIYSSPEKEKNEPKIEDEIKDFKFKISSGFNSQKSEKRPEQLLKIDKIGKIGEQEQESNENYSPIKNRYNHPLTKHTYNNPEDQPFN